MTEREKVIKGLDCCMGNPNFGDICPYAGTGDETHYREYCDVKLIKDTIALLKEQGQEIEFLKNMQRQMVDGFGMTELGEMVSRAVKLE